MIVDCKSTHKTTKYRNKGGETMTNTKLLEEVIEKSGYKKSYIAKKIGLSAFGLANKINNVTEFKTSEINGLCELLNIHDLEEKEKIFFAV